MAEALDRILETADFHINYAKQNFTALQAEGIPFWASAILASRHLHAKHAGSCNGVKDYREHVREGVPPVAAAILTAAEFHANYAKQNYDALAGEGLPPVAAAIIASRVLHSKSPGCREVRDFFGEIARGLEPTGAALHVCVTNARMSPN